MQNLLVCIPSRNMTGKFTVTHIFCPCVKGSSIETGHVTDKVNDVKYAAESNVI